MIKKVGITGGIGSGKSTVCRILEAQGVPVYDSDARAKALMHTERDVMEQLVGLFGPEAYAGGEVNRPYIASLVFTDESLMARMNAIVHPAVYRDFERWADSREVREELARNQVRYVVLESAILIESGWNERVDRTVVVTAPERVRIDRVVRRDRTSEELVRMRIRCQMSDPERLEYADEEIVADERRPVLPQVLALHEKLNAL